MNWVLSVLAGIAVAVLVLYFIKKNQAPVAIETYVQQPVRKGADISEQDSMLVAVGLQALYTPRPSVMDASEISKDAWLASQAAATGGAPSPASARVQAAAAAAEQQAPVGAGSGMAGSPMWSAGAMAGQASSGQAAQMQVFLPGAPSAAEQLQAPAPASSGAAAPRARTQAEIDDDKAKATEYAINQSNKNAALQAEAADAKAKADNIAALKADAERVYRETWLPARPSGSRTDTTANRTSYVASLQAKLQLDTLNFNNYFDSEYKSLYGATSIGTEAYKIKKDAAKQVLFDAQDTITALDTNWQSSNAVDCYPVPWPAFASETQCSKSCGDGMKTQTRKYVEAQNGGQACPTVRETRDVPCNLRACTYSTQPAQAVCASGSTYNTTSKKCVETSQLNPANGCTTGFTYNTSTGYCNKTGTTPVLPTPPPGFTFNTTTKKFEKTSDATFTCATAGYNISRGWTGLQDPFCEAYV
jgi:hypothetical protein